MRLRRGEASDDDGVCEPRSSVSFWQLMSHWEERRELEMDALLHTIERLEVGFGLDSGEEYDEWREWLALERIGELRGRVSGL